MKVWEFDVEVRVRKTFALAWPSDQVSAHALFDSLLIAVAAGQMDPSPFLAWTDGRKVFRPVPIETWIDNDPQIVAWREVSE